MRAIGGLIIRAAEEAVGAVEEEEEYEREERIKEICGFESE